MRLSRDVAVRLIWTGYLTDTYRQDSSPSTIVLNAVKLGKKFMIK